eukprot:gene6612-7685_t
MAISNSTIDGSQPVDNGPPDTLMTELKLPNAPNLKVSSLLDSLNKNINLVISPLFPQYINITSITIYQGTLNSNITNQLLKEPLSSVVINVDSMGPGCFIDLDPSFKSKTMRHFDIEDITQTRQTYSFDLESFPMAQTIRVLPIPSTTFSSIDYIFNCSQISSPLESILTQFPLESWIKNGSSITRPLTLDLTGNNGVTGEIPEMYCSSTVASLTDLMFTSAPECIYCQWNAINITMPPTVPHPPSNFKCHAYLDKYHYIIPQGTTQFDITGWNLGLMFNDMSTNIQNKVRNIAATFTNGNQLKGNATVVFSYINDIQFNISWVTDTTFEANGYLFGFSMLAIEELDSNRAVASHIITDSWMFNQTLIGDLTTLTYTLKTTSTSTPSLSVTTTIQHSDSQRVLEFAGLTTTLPANSIKIAVNVIGWRYRSTLNTLRLVFQTQVSDPPSAVDCGETAVAPNNNDNDIGDINYLRVVKGNVTFYGHFLSVGLSDGRSTYSKNEVINHTTNGLANIGINMPQCSECLIDPSFSVLISTNLPATECPDEAKSKAWLIATIVSIVGVVVIAASITTFMVIKKKMRFNKESDRMASKLKQIN